MLMTYKRTGYAIATLRTLYEFLETPFHLHIADDGSDMAHIDALRNLAREYSADGTVTVTTTPRASGRASYGHSYNLATQIAHNSADYILMLEDDWTLRKTLNLDEYMADMEDSPELECVRLGYLSWTQPISGKLHCGPNNKYVLLDPNSPEPHVWAGHPRLEKVTYQREVGAWPEGLLPGQTEFAVTHIRRARYGVAWPIGLDPREGYGYFAHIGSERSY